MANLYWRNLNVGSASTDNINDDNWNTASDSSGTWHPADVGNDLILDNNADCGDCDCNDNVDCDSLTMTGYTGTLDITTNLTVSGNAIMDGTITGAAYLYWFGNMTFTTGMTNGSNIVYNHSPFGLGASNTITFNSVINIDLEVNNDDSTLTAQDGTALDHIILYDGEFDDNGQTFSVTGNCFFNGGIATLDGDWDVNTWIAFTGLGTLNGAGTLNIEGNIVGEGDTTNNFTGTFIWDGAAAKDITYDGMRIPLEVNAASTLTALDAGYLASFLMTAGTYASGGFTHNAYGNVTYAAGTCTGLDLVALDDLDLDWDNEANLFDSLSIATAAKTITLVSDAWTKKLVATDGTIADGIASYSIILQDAAADFCEVDGCSYEAYGLQMDMQLSRNNSKVINCSTGTTLIFDSNSSYVLTQSVNMTVGELVVSSGLGDNGGITLTGTAVLDVDGNVDILSADDLGASLILNSGETHTIGSFVGTRTIFSAAHELNVHSSDTLDVSGAFDLTGLPVFAGSGDIEVEGSITGEGAATNTYTGTITWDGGGAENITYDGMVINLEVDGVGVLTSQDAGTLYSWLLSAGTYVDGGFAHNVAGFIVRNSGTLTSTGIWTQTASGNVKLAAIASLFYKIILASTGVTSNMTGDVYAKQFEMGDGTIVQSGVHDILAQPTVGMTTPFITNGTTWNTPNKVWLRAVGTDLSIAQANGDIDVGGNVLTFQGKTSPITWTIGSDGRVDIHATTVRAWNLTNGLGTGDMTIDFNNGSSITATTGGIDLIVDNYPVPSVTWYLGTGTHALAGIYATQDNPISLYFESSMITMYDDINLTYVDTVDFGTSIINLNTNSLNGAGIVDRNNTSGVVYNGTVENTKISDADTELDATNDCVDDGNNYRVLFDHVDPVPVPIYKSLNLLDYYEIYHTGIVI